MASGEEVPGDPAARNGTSGERADDEARTGLYSPALYFESKRRVLELVRIFADHGYVSLEEVASAMGRSRELLAAADSAALRRQVRELEAALQEARLANELAAWDLRESERALGSERELVQESVARIASLEGQLQDARRTTLKLIAASRNGLATLKRVRDHLAQETYAAGALTPLVHDFQELTQVVQELHVLSVVKAAAPSAPRAPR